jgi:3-phenylpropionate/cinnamic acid dioxygenase small subunit
MLEVIEEEKRDYAAFFFYQVDYQILKTASPTDKKGNPKTSERLRFNKQADELRSAITKIKMEKRELTDEEKHNLFKEAEQLDKQRRKVEKK